MRSWSDGDVHQWAWNGDEECMHTGNDLGTIMIWRTTSLGWNMELSLLFDMVFLSTGAYESTVLSVLNVRALPIWGRYDMVDEMAVVEHRVESAIDMVFLSADGHTLLF